MSIFKLIINQKGNTLVEVLVAIGLMGIMFPALAAALITSNTSKPTAVQQLSATNILRQMTDETRSIRESNWSNITTNGTFHPTISGNSWALTPGSTIYGNFTEQVVISDVQRNSSGDIVTSGGTLDPSTKLAVATVSWTIPRSVSMSSDIYLTRWQNESSWKQTTTSDFTGDSISNLTITNISGGEVILSIGQSSGTLTSSTFDAGSSVGFNFLTFNTNQPSGTNIKFQIATNNDNSTWNYIGPDGTSSTFYTSEGSIPLSAVNARYFRYQATLSTTSSGYPELDDLTLTYSP